MKTITDTITLALPAAAFPMDPERILFFDIETTGLSPRASSLYLIGTIHASGADHITSHLLPIVRTSYPTQRRQDRLICCCSYDH